MKNFIQIISLSLFLAFSFAANAQISVSISSAFGTKINNTSGLQIRVLHDLEIPWRVGLDYIHFPGGYDADLSTKVTEINANANYSFFSREKVFVYALAGLNITNTSKLFSFSTDSEMGMNVGIGSQFQLMEKLQGFAEIKYGTANKNQWVQSIGILYPF